MAKTGCDLLAMNRLLHRHQWFDIADWVVAIGQLADLSDDEIDEIVSPHSLRVRSL